MQLVEQHVIRPGSKLWQEIDAAAFASKNLYNLANYHMRQQFFADGAVFSYPALHKLLKDTDAYRSLPRKVSQQVLISLSKAWKGYFAAKRAYTEDPSKFLAEPKIPGYKDKVKGRNILTYTIQAISSTLLRIGQVKLSGLNSVIKTAKKNIDCVRVIPRKGFYVVEVVHMVEAKAVPLDSNLVAGVDLGVNNLAVVASNKPGFVPLLVNGRPLKSINQFYNKCKAELQKHLPGKRESSNQIIRLSNKRTRRVDHFLHVASRRIVDKLVAEGISTLVIGKNDLWKQEVNNGTRNNQNFVQIPHARFIEMLTYKCQLVGIRVVTSNESHTSKCSFLDGEPVCHQEGYVGKRVKRGLFRSATGRLINADLNGAYNIIRKVIPAAFNQGIEGVVVHPAPFGAN
jgi:putative transposase